MKRILAINPGSTSTKIAVYHDQKAAWMAGAHHPLNEINQFSHVNEQYAYRRDFVLGQLESSGIPLTFDAVIGRGGLLKPISGGVYLVNEAMKHDLWHAKMEHVCNLGGLIADEIASQCGCQAFIADPVVVDEMLPKAHMSGVPGLERKSVFHALNSKAVARRYAASVGKRYEDMNVIVAHLGGGISIGAHRKGKVIDVNNALDGDGPFSPERAGTLPAGALVDLCFSGKYNRKQVYNLIRGGGGLMAHLGTTDMVTVARKAEDGEEPYCSVLEAMLYTIAKQIGAMYVALMGEVDAIILTGGIAYSDYCVEAIKRQTCYMAPVAVSPGEGEMESLAYNALGVLNGTLPLLEYK